MDIFKRELAPIPAEAWAEIDAQASRSLKALLSARKWSMSRNQWAQIFPAYPRDVWNNPSSNRQVD